MNIDLQTLDVFRKFVDVIKNIDTYSEYISQTQAVIVDLQNAQADLLKGKTLAAWEVELQNKADKVVVDQAASQKLLDGRASQLDYRAQSLDIRESNIAEQERGVQTTLVQLASVGNSQDQKARELAKKEQDLNSQIDQYNKLEQELTLKQTQLQQILGS